MSQELEAADKQLVLMMAGSTASHDRVERYAMGRHVDGVLFASMHGADPLPGALARMGIPVVCGGRPLGRATVPVPYVDVDHIGGVARPYGTCSTPVGAGSPPSPARRTWSPASTG